MKQELKEILKRYVSDVRALYGEHLCEVILYGSYARSDYRKKDFPGFVIFDFC